MTSRLSFQTVSPIEFARCGIKNVTQANRFLEEEYRELFNQKFSMEPEAAGLFSFKNCCFQILDEGFPIINARREITVLMNPRYGINTGGVSGAGL